MSEPDDQRDRSAGRPLMGEERTRLRAAVRLLGARPRTIYELATELRVTSRGALRLVRRLGANVVGVGDHLQKRYHLERCPVCGDRFSEEEAEAAE